MAWALFWLCLAAVALPLAGYPLAVLALGRLRPAPAVPAATAGALPRTTVVIAFTGTGELLADKLANLAAVAGGDPAVDVVLASDGPLPPDRLERALKHAGELQVTAVSLERPRGKAHALNLAMARAGGDILLFSDLDAALAPGALGALLRWFRDPDVGAVCGRRAIRRDGSALAASGQRAYADLDSRIKLMENRLGAITSNDGKLYAVRRDLARPIQPAASDDLYNALSVVAQGYKLLFEPQAVAHIPVPAWTVGHELARRRRVTVRSLSGILHRPGLLLTPRFCLFGPRLVVNKLFRRLLPFSLAGLTAACALLAPAHAWAGAALAALLLTAAGAGLFAWLDGTWLAARLPGPLRSLWSGAFYALLGQLGMALGVIDFLRGRRISQWTPRKAAS